MCAPSRTPHAPTQKTKPTQTTPSALTKRQPPPPTPQLAPHGRWRELPRPTMPATTPVRPQRTHAPAPNRWPGLSGPLPSPKRRVTTSKRPEPHNVRSPLTRVPGRGPRITPTPRRTRSTRTRGPPRARSSRVTPRTPSPTRTPTTRQHPSPHLGPTQTLGPPQSAPRQRKPRPRSATERPTTQPHSHSTGHTRAPHFPNWGSVSDHNKLERANRLRAPHH